MPAPRKLFSSHLNSLFVETGSYFGDGIQAALDSGFEKVVSIELSDKYYMHCIDRFFNEPRVKVIKGDSGIVLPTIVNNLSQAATFWLDGHYSAGDTALGEDWCPLIKELSHISKSPIKTHTIIIDDMRCWEKANPAIGFGKEEIIHALIKINNAYTFSWSDGFNSFTKEIYTNDILIAKV